MSETSDAQLLRDYAADGNEAAFRELVTRHTDFVYSAAVRQVDSPDLACDIAQSVFTDLARKARPLAEKFPAASSLAGWLHRSTRYAALNHLRDTRRRLANERQAMEQLLTNSEAPVNWEQIRPALDEALDCLGDEDREALLLRYFKNQDFRAVGLALGMSDDAAQKRVSRAVERLREFFAKRGVTVGASGLVVVISANAVHAAPVGLAVTISTAAATVAGTTIASTTTLTATKAIVMTTLQKTLVTATVAVLAGAGIYEAREASELRNEVQTLQQQQAPLAEKVEQLSREREEATRQLAALRDDKERLDRNTAELLRLRGISGVARRANVEAEQLRTQLAQLTRESGTNPVTEAMADGVKQAMEQQVKSRLSRMVASLHLTPEQTQAAHEILTRQAHAMSTGMQQAWTGRFDKEELVRLGKETGNIDAQIKALLTPDQQAAYQNYQQEEAAYNARMAVNSELLQLQTLDLTQEQQDRAFAALYEVTFKQLTGSTRPSSTNQAEAMLWVFDQKAKALESVLTPAQMKNYTQQQAMQAKLIKDIMNKLEGAGGSK